ncbi:MAG: hypothetical protein ACXV8O_01590 [Methylobacter sp.]
MTKSAFESQCRALEDQGYCLVTFEPKLKYAVYRLGQTVREVGSKKR